MAEVGEIVIESTGEDSNIVIYAIISLIIIILLSLMIAILIAFLVYRWRVKKRKEDARSVHLPNQDTLILKSCSN